MHVPNEPVCLAGCRYLTNVILKHIAGALDVEKPRSSQLLNDMQVIEAQYKSENLGGEWNKRPQNKPTAPTPDDPK